jgi:hypothetical protein
MPLIKHALVELRRIPSGVFSSRHRSRYNHRSQMFRWSQVLFLAIDRLAPDPLDMIELPGTGPLCSGADSI